MGAMTCALSLFLFRKVPWGLPQSYRKASPLVPLNCGSHRGSIIKAFL